MPRARLLAAAALGLFAVSTPPAGLAQVDLSKMRTYFVVLMMRGEPAPPGTDGAAVMQAHLASMTALASRRQLVGAGPIAERESRLRGIFILDVATRADAERIANDDPAVKAGRLKPVVLAWFAEKGVGDGYFERTAGKPDVEVPMADYQFGLLMRGPKADAIPPGQLEAIQKGHMAHIGKMAEGGLLVTAGPFEDGGDYRGIFVFRAASLEQARALAEQDPAVQAGRLRLDLYPWKVAEGVFRK